ncbi:MAG TPA: PfkB family carbohydrate kinase [Candidatus Paceibacterota bacterium]|nr:PfkB family carbohydrate kinase [Candidatus Paceibacterota bacterium]
MEKQFDFMAIGDIVTDAFIRLKDAEVHCDIDEAHCKLCVRFGDKIPYESVEEVKAVGNSANAAVAAARLGLSASLLAHVGNDYQGTGCLDTLKAEQVDTSLIGVHDGLPTNYHYVLWYGVERTILVKHTHFPVSFPMGLQPPKMMYLSSLGDGTEAYHQEIAAYIEAHPEIKLVFQPGTFQMKMGIELLARLYKHTYAFFCNVEEAQRILKTEEKDINILTAKIHELGPRLVFIHNGIKGAYGSDGTNLYYVPVYPHDPFERTGAGDAFASTVSAALLMGKTLEEALLWGPVNSMSVVQQVGAQKGLLSREKLEAYLKIAPADYQIKKL